MTNPLWDRIVALRKQGLTYRETAQRCGVTPDIVGAVMRHYGLTGVGLTRPGPRRKIPPEVDAQIVELRRSGLSGRETAERMGVKQWQVWQAMKRAGLTQRFRSNSRPAPKPKPKPESFIYNGRRVPGRPEDWDEWELHYLYVELPRKAERRELTA